MNWRALLSLALALAVRPVVIGRLGWTYRPFRDAFSFYAFSRDATVFLLIFGVCFAVINAVFPAPKE